MLKFFPSVEGINFPLILKLGLNNACKTLLITTHEYLLQYAAKYKTEKQITTSHHNIGTIILGMEILGKTQDGKTAAAVRYIFYYEKIWNFYNHCKFTQT